MSNELLIKSIKARQAMAAHAAKVESTVENVDTQADDNTSEIKKLIKSINSDFNSAQKVPADLLVVNYKQILNTLTYPVGATLANHLFTPSMPLFLQERKLINDRITALSEQLTQTEITINNTIDTLRLALKKEIADGDAAVVSQLTIVINELETALRANTSETADAVIAQVTRDFLGINAQAKDSARLGGLLASRYLRNDVSGAIDGGLELLKGDLKLKLGGIVLKKESGFWLSTSTGTGIYFNSANPNDIKLEFKKDGVTQNTLSISSGVFTGYAETSGLASYVDIKEPTGDVGFRQVTLTDTHGKIYNSAVLEVDEITRTAKTYNMDVVNDLHLGLNKEATIRYNRTGKSIDFIFN